MQNDVVKHFEYETLFKYLPNAKQRDTKLWDEALKFPAEKKTGADKSPTEDEQKYSQAQMVGDVVFIMTCDNSIVLIDDT